MSDRKSKQHTNMIYIKIAIINVDKTKVMANDGTACRILIQNEQLEQMDTFHTLGP